MADNYFIRRLLEIIPASLSWSALVMPVIFIFFAPIAVVYFVICFDLYWLFKAILMGVHLILGYFDIKKESHLDWLSRCRKIKNLPSYLAEIESKIKYLEQKYPLIMNKYSFLSLPKKLRKEYKALREEKEEILSLMNFKNKLLRWDEVYHLVLLATYKEDKEIIRSSCDSYLQSDFPRDKLIIVLAVEERAGERARLQAEELKQHYQNKFFDFLISSHPPGVADEIKAKGANLSWAAEKVIKPYLEAKKISPNRVIVSAFDADTRVHPRYFACLTYKYITNPEREKRSFQPIPLYSNNIWQAPAFSRVVAFGASFWQMIESTRPYRLTNFSSHAMSFQTLLRINYWARDIVNEDSRQFWRAYFTFDGNHKCIPIFTPVYMDAVLAPSYLRTLKNQYLQKKRWAYGVEHFPMVVINSFKNKKIPWRKKGLWIFRLLEGHFSWATASIFIATAGWLPILLNPHLRFSVPFFNMAPLASRLLSLSWIGIATSMFISLLLLPKPPPRYRGWRRLVAVFQWILMPFSVLFFGSIPALDAQTQLALGRYLEFWVTEKVPLR